MCKSLSKAKEKEHLPVHDGGASSRTVMSPARNRQIPLKTFTSKYHSFYCIHQSDFSPHKTSFPPDTVSLQGFDTTLWWQISSDWYKVSKNSTVAKGEEAKIGRRGGCVCLRQLTWKKGLKTFHTQVLVTIYSSWAIWKKGTLIPSSVFGQQIAAVLQHTAN